MNTDQMTPNDPRLESFVPVAADSHFPIQNLPFGVFRTATDPSPRAGVAIGEFVLDLREVERAGLLQVGPDVLFGGPTLKPFLESGKRSWDSVRRQLSVLLRHDSPRLRDDVALRERVLVPCSKVSMQMPMDVKGFSDFLLSKEHAQNSVNIVGGAKNGQLWPNWHHFPMGYNSRASSVVVSGTPVRRPRGQIRDPGAAAPRFGTCRQLDFELETALVVGKPNALGCPVEMAQFAEHAFGVVLLNDWSARDIQQWEAQPLGVFNSKNFATSISPWIVTLSALEPFRVDGPEQNPAPLPYLRPGPNRNFDVHLEASIWPEDAPQPFVVCRSELQTIYWSFAQQLVHHTSAGCNMQAGDLLGSGTVSNGEPGALACLFEITRDGRDSFDLGDGKRRMYLLDGDLVTLTGWCQADGYRVGFGTCDGRIAPALHE